MSDISLTDLIGALQIMQAKAAAGTPLDAGAIYKHTANPSGTPSTPYYNGPGGLFGVSQVPERDVFSTRVQTRGLLSALNWRASADMYPLFPYLTGFQTYSGSQPTTSCGTCKTPGAGKSCYQTAPFGKNCRDTRELDIVRVGQRIDRGDTFDYRLVNDPLAQDLTRALFPGLPEAAALVNGREALARMIEAGISLTNELCPLLYTGDPANNSGDYAEFMGLDMLIGTTKVDALTQTDCPSLDALVRDWNYGSVTDMSLDIVREIAYIARYLKNNASRMGYDPTTWVIVMREGLFYELTSIWPCAYLTNRCWVNDSANIDAVPSVNAADGIRLRDEMRNQQYLLIDGQKWTVVFDDCIVEENSGNTNKISATCFASDIYFVPMTVLGGTIVTYMEYYDFSGAVQAANDWNYQGTFWTDGGRYLWARLPNVSTCIQLKVKHWPRLIFKAPFLSARLTNVQYCPLIHNREPLPTDAYFVDGGVSTPRAAPSYYSDWNTGRQ